MVQFIGSSSKYFNSSLSISKGVHFLSGQRVFFPCEEFPCHFLIQENKSSKSTQIQYIFGQETLKKNLKSTKPLELLQIFIIVFLQEEFHDPKQINEDMLGATWAALCYPQLTKYVLLQTKMLYLCLSQSVCGEDLTKGASLPTTWLFALLKGKT